MPNKITTSFSKGLNLSTDPVYQPKDSYSYGLNVVKENLINNPEIISNEKGFGDYLDLGYDYILLGNIYLGNFNYILFIKNNDSTSPFNRIILVENKNIKIIRDNLDLNFDSSHPVIGTYRIDYNNNRIIYFVDGLNSDRVINVDIDNSGVDIALLSMNASSSSPLIDVRLFDEGGGMVSGQYFFGISYNVNSSFTTNVLNISTPVSVANEKYFNTTALSTSITELFGNTDGDIINTVTTKKAEIKISKLNPIYESYNIIAIRKQGESFVYRTIRDIPISTDTVVFTGINGVTEDITLDDIIVDSINYYASNAISQKDNRLVRGNTKVKGDSFDYQRFANNIIVNYKINTEPVYLLDNVYNSSSFANLYNNFRIDVASSAPKKHSISPSYLANTGTAELYNNTSFMRDEVYSLGIGFKLVDGTETQVFHIPGRVNDVLQNSSGAGEYNTPVSFPWDTQNDNGSPRWVNKNTAINNGTLAYWRSDITYEDNFDFPTNGEKAGNGRSYIRHHKMPSDILEPIYTTTVTGDPNVVNTTSKYEIYKRNISLVFSNIIIPDEYKDIIDSITFYYTPRDESNKSVLSKGLLRSTYLNTSNGIEQSAYFNGEGNDYDDKTIFEFISPETNFKFKKSFLTGNRIKVCGVDKGYVNFLGGYFQNNWTKDSLNLQNMYPYMLFNNDLKDRTNRYQSTISSFCFYNQRTIPKADYYSRGLDKIIFADGNYVGTSDIGSLNLRGSQDTAFVKLSSGISMRKPAERISVLYPELLYPTNASSANSNPKKLEITDELSKGMSESTYAGKLSARLNEAQARGVYYDTSYYVSIISNNPSQYGNIRDLTYTKICNTMDYKLTNGNNSIVTYEAIGGDTFIESHHNRQSKYYTVGRSGDYGKLGFNVKGEFRDDFEDKIGQEFTVLAEVYEIGIQNYSSFICETDLNIRMRNEGDGEDEKYFPKSYLSTINNSILISGQIDRKEYYNISDAYNTKHIKLYFPSTLDKSSTNYQSDKRYSSRIVYSNTQNLESRTDNYRTTLANNYRDLPLDKGQISVLFSKNEKLYAVTRDTIFNVFTSTQTLKTNNDTILNVGTGEFLGVEPIDMLSIIGGFAGSESKLSFTESPFGYLYVNKLKGKIILFDESINDIAEKDILSFINDNGTLKLLEQLNISVSGFDNPLNGVGFICGYDNQLNRFLITKLDYILTPEALTRFKGVYNPSTSYVDGDLYIKDNVVLHKYIESEYTVINKVNTNILTDFIQGDTGAYPWSIDNAPSSGTITEYAGENDNYFVYQSDPSFEGTVDIGVTTTCRNEILRVNVVSIPFKWIVDYAGSSCELDGNGDNTGYSINTIIKKVTDDSFVDPNKPLDVNGQLTSVSGLPQESKTIDSSDPMYRVIDSDFCSLVTTVDVTITVRDYYVTFAFEEPLEDNLQISYTYAYYDGVTDNSVNESGLHDIIAGSDFSLLIFSLPPNSAGIYDFTITFFNPDPVGNQSLNPIYIYGITNGI